MDTKAKISTLIKRYNFAETSKCHGVHRLLIFFLLLLVSVMVTGCNSADDEELYSVSITLSGEAPTAQVLVLNDFENNVSQQRLTVNSLGRATFKTALPENNRIQLVLPPGLEDEPACRFDQNDGLFIEATLDSSDFNADATCHESYSVSGEVTGLPVGQTMHIGFSTGLQPVLSENDANFSDHSYIDGDSYEVEILEPPADPDIECSIKNGSGVINKADVDDVLIRCGKNHEIGGVVTNMLGTGMTISLNIAQPEGALILLGVEDQIIDGDGDFKFDKTLLDEDYYEVQIINQPTNPAQFCVIENESGIVDGEDVTDIEINCEQPKRTFLFHDYESFLTSKDNPPYGDPLDPPGLQTQIGGIVDEIYLFKKPPSQPIASPLGTVSGVSGTELFNLHFNDSNPSAVIYSNESGETYWLAAEVGPDFLHHAELHTTWRFRKENNDARFSLLISQINILGYAADFITSPQFGITLRGRAAMHVHAHHLINGDPTDTPFFNQSGTIELIGRENPTDPFKALWTILSSTLSPITSELWDKDDFEISTNLSQTQPDRVALLTLNQPIVVEVDLSNVPLGGEFIIVSDAGVNVTNYGSAESTMAVYLRDPAGFDPGESPELAGASIQEMEGLVMLSAEDIESGALSIGGGEAPVVCDPSVTDLSVLQFSDSEYELNETELYNVLNNVLVTREGSSAGLVTAQVSVTGDTAVFDEDYVIDQLEVRFGDGSTHARTLDFGIIDDVDEEQDEIFTINLHSPEGCAEIGPQNTATVTILASDPARGTASFATDSYRVNEAAGELEILVERLGGDFGLLPVRISSADGTALAGSEYNAINAELVVFASGDSTPKTVRITIQDDPDPEVEKDFSLTITADDPEYVGAPDTTTVTIVDNDGPLAGSIQLSASAYAVTEDAGQASITITRSGGSDGEVSVELSTGDGSALSGDDYQPVIAQPVTFADGETTDKQVDIVIIDDPFDEGEHRFNVSLANPTGGAELGIPLSADIVIEDNDGVVLPPQAPIVTIDAGVKNIEFDWGTVNDVTHYQLMNSIDGINFIQLGDDIGLGETTYSLPIAVHLFDWENTQFMIQACNSAGCTDSNIVDSQTLMLNSIGFFKGSNTEAQDFFGFSVAVSGDGQTIAIGAFGEDSDALFIDGNQTDNSASSSGAVYVFNLTGNSWQQQAYVKAPEAVDNFDGFGFDALALSADGNTLAVSASGDSETEIESGAVYLYSRENGNWFFDTKLKASNLDADDLFGSTIAISDDGNRLAIGAIGEDSNATGVDGIETNNDEADAGAVYIFERSVGIWTQISYIKASNTDAGDRFGASIALSGDGSQLAVGASREDSASTGINGDESDNSYNSNPPPDTETGTGAVYLFSQTLGAWNQDAYIKPSNTDNQDAFGHAIALSFDGSRLVAGASYEDSAATGNDPVDEADNSADRAGAVYIFDRTGSVWQQTHYIKASNSERFFQFGIDVDISDDGQTFIATAIGDSSLATGVNGDQSQPTGFSNDTGAGYIFSYDANASLWEQTTYIKPSNADQNSTFPSLGGRYTSFGLKAAISGNAETLVMGAYTEESIATGINGDQVNQDAPNAGAAYIY